MATLMTMEATLAAIERYKQEIMEPLQSPADLSDDQLLEVYCKKDILAAVRQSMA